MARAPGIDEQGVIDRAYLQFRWKLLFSDSRIVYLEPMKMESMTPEEFSFFREASLSDYSQELAKASAVSLEVARTMAEEQFGQLLPEGLRTPNHFFRTVRAPSGDQVGHLWYSLRDHHGRKRVFICDIHLLEEHRGHGYGRRALEWLEVETRALGANEIGLHVFGHNERAKRLYDLLGYQVANIQMVKTLATEK